MENDKLDKLDKFLNEVNVKLKELKKGLITQILDTIIFMLTVCFVVSGNITLFYIGVFILILQVIVGTECIIKLYKVYKSVLKDIDTIKKLKEFINKSKQSV